MSNIQIIPSTDIPEIIGSSIHSPHPSFVSNGRWLLTACGLVDFGNWKYFLCGLSRVSKFLTFFH